MSIHPSFSTSPYEILDPAFRWFPADEALRESSYDKLLPPLVNRIRREVKLWRDSGYDGVTKMSKALLDWWFKALTHGNSPHGRGEHGQFEYYFAQLEAIETIIYLYLEPSQFNVSKVQYKQFSEEEKREIVFKDITTGETTHTTYLDSTMAGDCRSVIGYFAQVIMKDLRLISGYDVLCGKVETFIAEHLFDRIVEIDDLNTIRNLSELEACKAIIETFKKKINELTVVDKGNAEMRDYIKLRQTRPFVVKDQGFLIPQKSIFNKIIGDSHLELLFASFLERCPDIVSYAKNYLAVHFKLDYVSADGSISNYYPDFIVKANEKDIYIVETKGIEDLDVSLKIERLKNWCADINKTQKKYRFDFIFVDEEDFERYKPDNFEKLVRNFRRYKG